MKESKNIHEGHRQRLYSRFFNSKGKDMQDYEVLEVLLCQKIPRANVNPTAHRLINKFGSFDGVLDANIQDLVKIEGIGKSTAIFLTSIPLFINRYFDSKIKSKKEITNLNQTTDYIKSRLSIYNTEVFMIIALTLDFKILGCEVINIGDHDHVEINVKDICKFALKHNAANIVIAHNHITGTCDPSYHDLITTELIYNSLKSIKTNLIDHIIITQNNYYSFFSNGIIDDIRDKHEEINNKRLLTKF